MVNPKLQYRVAFAQKGFFYPFILTFALSLLVPSLLRAAPLESVGAEGKLSKTGSPPALLPKVEVQGKLVTLGDLFSNLHAKAGVAVFRAPDPGTTGHVSVRRILAAARKHNIALKAKPRFARVAISRASRVIEQDEMTGLVRQRLEKRLSAASANSGGHLVIKLPENLKQVHVAPQIEDELSLSSLNWSRQSGRFSARFALGDSKKIKISGTASLMIDIAVPRNSIAAGSTLAQSDLEIIQIRAGRNNSQKMARLQQMVGKAARHALRAGKPVRLRDLETPKLIHKNQLVTIMLEAPGLILRTQGKALGDAAKGESVRVLNTRSKRIIHATARADGLVFVKTAKQSRTGS